MPGIFSDIINGVKTLIFGKGKARLLFDQLKANPTSTDLVSQIKELFRNDPIAVVSEILRRVDKIEKPKPGLPDTQFVKLRQTWDNTIKKERVQPLLYMRPTTKQELVDIVLKAEADGMLVRAVGTGHSFSDVANATDVLVDMLLLKNTLAVETDTFKPGFPVLFNAEGGMLVQKVNSELDKKGFALPTMAAFDQETIYGAIATSTHGTGLNVSGMAAMVRSMDLVAHEGKVYRLEPTKGITDPVKFAAKYPNKEIILIQNDDKFYSSVVGFGLMGIVYSVVIEPVKAFYLKQRLWVTNWDVVKPKLLDRTFFTSLGPDWEQEKKDPVTNQFAPTRAQVFVNPYTTKNFITRTEGHTCTVQIQTEITKAEYNKLNAQVTNRKDNKILALFQSILSNGSTGVHEETVEAQDKNNIVADISTDALLLLLNDFPLLTPMFLDVSLIILLSGSGKFGKSFTVMNQGKLAVKNAGYSVEPGLAVDASNQFVTGAEEIMKVIKSCEVYASYLTSPICMRFVKASDDYLSPEYKTDTCMIDVPLMLGSIGDDQMLDRLQVDLVAMGARPHWGKICNLVNGDELIRKMYPKYDAFLATVNFFNPTGTFNSTFSYRTGISKMEYDRK